MAWGSKQATSVYNARPYHAYLLSDDGEDDDVCVWENGPTFSEIYMSEVSLPNFEQIPIFNKKKAPKDNGAIIAPQDNVDVARSVVTETPATAAENSVNLAAEQIRERQAIDSLLVTQRNLTKMLQFILKLECRAGKVAKEGIRQTLDATVADNSDMSDQGHDVNPFEEIEDIKLLSENAWQRLYLIDRHWRKQSREDRDAEGQSPSIEIESEPSVKAWLKEEMRANCMTGDDPCYFTAADLAGGRRFEDWIAYLRLLCKFRDHPDDEAKLVGLAWRFLDRNLRGPRPVGMTRVADFVFQLEERCRGGGFEEALEDPKRQELDDEWAWKTIKKCWSSGV
ncbi:hypothetical protein F4804DRAFT_351519 [Jackrogersella minutella]|nr:hypothetical protein F4804DRAFT_351519 [Jackrogersella minutella]